MAESQVGVTGCELADVSAELRSSSRTQDVPFNLSRLSRPLTFSLIVKFCMF